MAQASRVIELLKSRVLLQYEWGYKNPHSLINGMSFMVDGEAFCGTVKIIAQSYEDTFEIYLINKHNELVRKISGVTEKDLVITLRANIDGSDSWKKIWKKYYKDKWKRKK